MAQVLLPRTPKDQITAIAQALNIASSVYGIRGQMKNYEQLQAQQAEREVLEDPASQQSEQLRQRFAAAGQQVDPGLSAKELTARFGDPEALEQRQFQTQQAERKALAEAQEKAQATQFKEREISVKERLARLKEEEKGLKEAETDPFKKKTEKLSGESRKRLDNIRFGKRALDQMAKALSEGQNTFSLVGDNDYTFGSKQWEEAIGRMQSGGAINAEEATRFRALVPGPTDSRDIQAKKLDTMKQELESRLEGFGLEPKDVPKFVSKDFESQLGKISSGGGLDRIIPQAAAGDNLEQASDADLDSMLLQLMGGGR